MKKQWKRIACLVLAAALLWSLCPKAEAKGPENRLPDYETADAIFEKLDALAEKGPMDAATEVRQVYSILSRTDGVREGSLEYQGTDRVVWMTEDGVSCVYDTRYTEIAARCTPVEEPMASPAEPQVITHGKDVYLIEPYFNIDQSFTGQYQREAQTIAAAMGGHYFLRARDSATIDKVAQALENGGLVIFDSHGNTDYSSGADATSGATTSYLCLSTAAGVTAQDYEDHHANYSKQGGIVFCEVDGAAISNHMTKDATHTMIWAAICLGMATDGLCRPLMERGVDVMYGYSQSVSFAGDYCFEAACFESMLSGRDLAAAIADMKDKCGLWDYAPQMGIGASYSTIEAARRARCAFPIVASQEDAYPGHGNVDDLQEVKSTWRLLEQPCRHPSTEIVGKIEAACFQPGYSGDIVCRLCGEVLEQGFETVIDPSRCPLSAFGDLDRGKWYHEAVEFALSQGIMKGTGSGFAPGRAMTRAELATILWNLEGSPLPQGENVFSDVKESFWGRNAILWASESGIVTGSGGRFMPNDPVTREQAALMLMRYAGGTAPEGDHLSAFPDGGSVSSWAKEAVNWAVAEEYLRGSGKLNPRGSMSRAEMAQLMLNYLSKAGI